MYRQLSNAYLNSSNVNVFPSANNDKVARPAALVAALVVLEKRGVHKALSDEGSVGSKNKQKSVT
jgi:hypothetical protein